MSGRLVVCPTPIGNLEDVTLRVLAALREADVVACEDTRHTRVLLERYGVTAKLVATTSTTSARGPPSWSSGCAAARSSRSSATRGCRSSPTPASRSCRAASRRGCPSRCCPGRRRRSRRWWRARCRPTSGASPGFLPRKRGPLEAASGAGDVVAFESPNRLGASLAVLAELDPERPVAVCRELTKLHEEIVRGTAAELAARYADEAPRGEIVLVVGGAPERTAPTRRRSRPCARWSSPAPARGSPRTSSPSSPARRRTRSTARSRRNPDDPGRSPRKLPAHVQARSSPLPSSPSRSPPPSPRRLPAPRPPLSAAGGQGGSD